MSQPVTVETLFSPLRYSPAQIDTAVHIATVLHRGKFVLTITPSKDAA